MELTEILKISLLTLGSVGLAIGMMTFFGRWIRGEGGRIAILVIWIILFSLIGRQLFW